MPRALTSLPAWVAAWGLLPLLAGCGSGKPKSEPLAAATASAGATADKPATVPLTTESDEARTLYLRGRALAEQLRLHDGRKLLEEALAKDSSFALAHYNLAITSAMPKDFFHHLKQAVALAERVSEGERLMILALEAGGNANPTKALRCAEELVIKYPDDERAHFILGNAWFGQQQYQQAVEQYQKAIEINPEFSPAYNSLGYVLRPMGRFDDAEKAFKKYIELIPDDPNPYDSYAELLMKTGRFAESIQQYRKALSIDPHFGNSHFGIASDLMFQGKHDEAITEAQKLYDAARDDGDRRLAMLTQTLIYVDQGRTAAALNSLQKQYALGARIGDTAAMSNDAVLMGNILLQGGRAEEAGKRFRQALDLVQWSSQSAEVKEDAQLADHYNLGRVALAKHDVAGAKTHASAYLTGAETRQNGFRIRQAHELAGAIALGEKSFDAAIGELAQANQQDPYVLYLTALAYKGKGDAAKARDAAWRAAEMDILPTLNYAFVRNKAKKMG